VGAALSGADLSDAKGKKVDFSGADLSGAILSKAKLEQASLSGSDLRGADLSSAKFKQTDVTDALYDDLTLWPNGFDLDGSGASYAPLLGGPGAGTGVAVPSSSDFARLTLVGLIMLIAPRVGIKPRSRRAGA